MRQSINPTYNSRETGPRFTVESFVAGYRVGQTKIADPFVTHTVKVHWWDALKCLLSHGRIDVQVSVKGDDEIQEDVMELDANYLGQDTTRRHEHKQAIEKALGAL